jgi:hypothetical protein
MSAVGGALVAEAAVGAEALAVDAVARDSGLVEAGIEGTAVGGVVVAEAAVVGIAIPAQRARRLTVTTALSREKRYRAIPRYGRLSRMCHGIEVRGDHSMADHDPTVRRHQHLLPPRVAHIQIFLSSWLLGAKLAPIDPRRIQPSSRLPGLQSW